MGSSLEDAQEKSDSTACQIDFWFVSFCASLPSVLAVTDAAQWQLMEVFIEPSRVRATFLNEFMQMSGLRWLLLSNLLNCFLLCSLSLSCFSLTVFLLPAVYLLDWTGGWSTGLCLLPEGESKCSNILGSQYNIRCTQALRGFCWENVLIVF